MTVFCLRLLMMLAVICGFIMGITQSLAKQLPSDAWIVAYSVKVGIEPTAQWEIYLQDVNHRLEVLRYRNQRGERGWEAPMTLSYDFHWLVQGRTQASVREALLIDVFTDTRYPIGSLQLARWSPTRNELVYDYLISLYWGILWFGEDGSVQQEFLDDPVRAVMNYRWSKNGERFIWYGIGRNANIRDIYTFEWEDRVMRHLAQSTTPQSNPIISPDGVYIAYTTRNEARIFENLMLDMTTGQTTRLPSISGQDRLVTWSSDGSAMIYLSLNPGGTRYNLYLVEPNADENVRLLVEDVSFRNTEVQWSPNGRYVIYLDEIGSVNTLTVPFVFDLYTRISRPLTHHEAQMLP